MIVILIDSCCAQSPLYQDTLGQWLDRHYIWACASFDPYRMNMTRTPCTTRWRPCDILWHVTHVTYNMEGLTSVIPVVWRDVYTTMNQAFNCDLMYLIFHLKKKVGICWCVRNCLFWFTVWRHVWILFDWSLLAFFVRCGKLNWNCLVL